VKKSVEALADNGWAVVPLEPGKKVPADSDWLNKSYSPDDFGPTHGVGAKCGSASQHRVDVDLDALEAVAAGARLLPTTDCIHGRPGKPASHHWYTCPGIKSFVFKDLDGEVLCEARSDGGQTALPPSTWTSKSDGHTETLVWVREGKPAIVDPDAFWRGVRATAVAALFARHWPQGARHYAAGHLAGLLIRLGYDAQWVPQIVYAVVTIAKDEEADDRVRIAKDTCAKHSRGEKFSGGPKLAEMFGRGDDLLKRVYSWFGMEGADLLDRLNEQHFVAQYGSDTVVGTETQSDTLEIQDFEAFRRRYYNQKVGKARLGEWWLSHSQQRRYRRIVFAPPPLVCHPEDYNTWRGFAVKPDPQPKPELRCIRFLEHLYKVICSQNQQWFEYLLDVCALTCQKPGKPTGVAVVLQGDMGAGKGSFVDNFGSLFGVHYIQVDKQEHVTGRFSAHLANKIVLFADEAIWAGNKQDSGALKRLVTERTLTIERKFHDAVAEPNCLHLFMATNERWVWPAGMHERRGFILKIPKYEWANRAYFDALHEEWIKGGNAAFLAFCLARVVPHDKLGPLPTTVGLIEQQQITLDPLMQWWLDKLQLGDLGLEGGWPTFVSAEWCLHDYTNHLRAVQARNPGRTSMVVLTNELTQILPPATRRVKRVTLVDKNKGVGQADLMHLQRWGWELPPLQTCRDYFDTRMGVQYPWDPVDATQALLPEDEDDAL
jgi:hypothetical protein